MIGRNAPTRDLVSASRHGHVIFAARMEKDGLRPLRSRAPLVRGPRPPNLRPLRPLLLGPAPHHLTPHHLKAELARVQVVNLAHPDEMASPLLGPLLGPVLDPFLDPVLDPLLDFPLDPRRVPPQPSFLGFFGGLALPLADPLDVFHPLVESIVLQVIPLQAHLVPPVPGPRGV